MGDTVLYEAADAVATLTLNRPERLNAITPQLVEDFDAALARALDDDEVRVVRLRGAGSAFCAGYDIGWGSESMQAAEAGAPWERCLGSSRCPPGGKVRPRRCRATSDLASAVHVSICPVVPRGQGERPAQAAGRAPFVPPGP